MTLDPRARAPRPHGGLSRNAYASQRCRVNTALWLLERIPSEDHAALADLIPEAAVVMWARSRRGEVRPEALAARFGFSRATACRWWSALVHHGVINEAPVLRAALEVVR